ncbi:MAG: hypothetical protein GY931_21305 [Maribacter sp.]|nr:hypothetical protein [Maribacter sp.]
MNAIVVGLIYGIAWYSIHFFVGRFIASKSQNVILSGVAPLLMTAPILLSIILFKPLVSNWESFVQMWGASFLVGALVIKFGVLNRHYK